MSDFLERAREAARSAEFRIEGLLRPVHLPDASGLRLKSEAKAARPVLNLADYVDPAAEPPPAVHRSHLGNGPLADVLGNDQWGDCGDAMAIHAIEAFHLDAGTPVPPFVTADALHLYSQVSGFDPSKGPSGSNPTDTGTDNQQLVDFWRNSGVTCAADGSNHKIAGSLFVDPKNQRVSKIAVWEFVVLFRALGLPITAQNQSEWTLVDPSLQGDAALGSWGYHDIPYLSYDSQRLRADSWGLPILADWDFDSAYAVQGIVVVTQEMLNLQGVSPAGVDWTALNADLAKFPAAPAS